MPVRISINIRGAEQFQNYLQYLPRGALRSVLKAVGEFVVSSEVLARYEPYQHVPRKDVYGFSFFTPAQQAYVMAKIKSGAILVGTRQASGAAAAGWHLDLRNDGYRAFARNETPGAYFTMGEPGQTRHAKAAGWKTVTARVRDSMHNIIGVAKQALSNWISRNRPPRA